MQAKTLPKYSLYKRTGQASVMLRDVVTGQRKAVYLGLYGSTESWEKYHRILAEWESNGRRLVDAKADRLTISRLCLVYWQQKVEGYYPTRSKFSYRSAVRRIRQLYGSTPAADFGPRDLQAIRQHMIDEGLVRTTINKQIGLMRQMFKWAVAQEMVPVTT